MKSHHSAKNLTASLSLALLAAFSGSSKAETTVTFKSEQKSTIKVCAYNTGDLVKAIPLWSSAVDPGSSVSWKGAPKKFMVKVFKPQFLDRELGSKNHVSYNTTVTIAKDHSISAVAKKPLVFKNSGNGTMKFAVYRANDSAMVVPSKTWTIKKGKSVTWVDAPAKFNLKVFKPGIIDKVVAPKKGVQDRRTVSINSKNKISA